MTQKPQFDSAKAVNWQSTKAIRFDTSSHRCQPRSYLGTDTGDSRRELQTKENCLGQKKKNYLPSSSRGSAAYELEWDKNNIILFLTDSPWNKRKKNRLDANYFYGNKPYSSIICAFCHNSRDIPSLGGISTQENCPKNIRGRNFIGAKNDN